MKAVEAGSEGKNKDNVLSVMFHEDEYYLYQGKSIKGKDMIIEG